ncbi:MAG TPA: flagellar assembly protein FliH [Paralcaligenes sp.]|jgi:flagellar assembly protein FliH
MSDSAKNRLHSRVENSWERWEMTAFDGSSVREKKMPPLDATAAGAVQTELDLEQLRSATSARARAQGYAAGHAEGINAGTAEGRKAGEIKGYETGFSAGHAEGRAQAQQAAQQLQSLADSFASAIGTIEAEMGQALIALAINIAQQVLRSTLAEHPDKILDLVRDIVLADLDKDAVLQLRVNPADLTLVEEYLAADSGIKNWRINGDETIERGGCTAETELGNIDATLQTRWRRVISSLGRASVSDGGRDGAGH